MVDHSPVRAERSDQGSGLTCELRRKIDDTTAASLGYWVFKRGAFSEKYARKITFSPRKWGLTIIFTASKLKKTNTKKRFTSSRGASPQFRKGI